MEHIICDSGDNTGIVEDMLHLHAHGLARERPKWGKWRLQIGKLKISGDMWNAKQKIADNSIVKWRVMEMAGVIKALVVVLRCL